MEPDKYSDSFSPDDVEASTDSEVDDPDVQELEERSKRIAQNELFKSLWEIVIMIIHPVSYNAMLTQVH